jgi:hypothetical protein
VAVPDWVTDIPEVPYRPLLEDWSIGEVLGQVGMSDIVPAGNPRMRSTSTVDMTQDSVSINMRDEETLNIFLLWVRDTLGRGAATFTMPVPYKGTYVKKRCQIVNGGNGIQRIPAGWVNGKCQWVVKFTRRIEDLYTNA